MSAEPKRDLAERIHAEADIASRAGQSDRLRVLAAEVRGYVSPEEATVREAAARREALLEAATAAEEQWRFWWGGDASWMTTATHVTGLMADALRNRAATERGEEQA